MAGRAGRSTKPALHGVGEGGGGGGGSRMLNTSSNTAVVLQSDVVEENTGLYTTLALQSDAVDGGRRAYNTTLTRWWELGVMVAGMAGRGGGGGGGGGQPRRWRSKKESGGARELTTRHKIGRCSPLPLEDTGGFPRPLIAGPASFTLHASGFCSLTRFCGLRK